MKTRSIITAAAIIFSISLASAGSKQRTVNFRDSFGRILTMPMKEEVPDSTPFDSGAEFNRIRQADSQTIFDLSEIIKPEKEEDLPFDLEEVFQTVK